MANIAIVGVGAIGGVLAGLLHQHNLTLCTRRPLTSLEVQTPEALVQVKAHNLTTPAQAESLPKPDWIIVATKTYDAPGAKLWLQALCGPQTHIAIVQNGVEHREHFAPDFSILPVIIDVPAERLPSGSILQRASAALKIEDNPTGQAFAHLFANTSAIVDLTPDFLTAAWQKLCINSAGILSALTLKPAGILRDEAIGHLALQVIAECVAVGRSIGANLEDGIPARILANYRAGSPDSINSLLADRLANRPLELEARNGIILRLGLQYGIPTPINRLLYDLLKASVA